MANIEDILQVKNDNVARVNAPLMANYPDGYVDTLKLPMALTWVMETVIDNSGTIATNTVMIDVLVQVLAQSNWRTNNKATKDLRDLFITEYSISAANSVISDDSTPSVRIVPGTVEFGGYRDILEAPDGSPFHGFRITMTVEEHLNVTC